MQSSEPFVKRAKAIEDRVSMANKHKREHGRYPDDLKSLTSEEQALLRSYQDARDKYSVMKKERGSRYEGCTLLNFEATTESQAGIVKALRDHVRDPDVIKSRNVVLFGPKGTGKDHLLNGVASAAFYKHGLTTMWRQGIDLHEKLRRDAFSEYRTDFMTPSSDTERGAPVLWVSDPLPPSGGLTEFQQSQLFSLIDRRYSDMLPTWISMNVADGSEAETRMGAQVVDRLKHDALVLHCNWESYRKPSDQR